MSNMDYTHLNDSLPGDIGRRVAMGDIEGALRLIDAALEEDKQPELAPRLRVERERLARLEENYPLSREEALARVWAEWPDFTEERFDALTAGGRIDWRCVRGRQQFHRGFLDSLRLYPRLAPGLRYEEDDPGPQRNMLERMRREGSVTARITLRAVIRPADGVEGSRFQAWLPIPAACPQQSGIEILDAAPGGVCAPEDAPQRTIWWRSSERREFFVTYRYLHRAVFADPMTIVPDPVQPDFDLEEEQPHLALTPYLRALTARVTAGCSGPVEKAKAIYDYITENVDYRYQPSYILLDSIADRCAAQLRGDCGVMSLLFIAMCRIAGIPARWQSGLAARPGHVGCHDWAMFYIAPHGWLWADCSFGSAARRKGREDVRRHYFGSMDPWRMAANSAFLAPLTPPDPAWRNDPFDNQSGEITADGVGLYGARRHTEQEMVAWELL